MGAQHEYPNVPLMNFKHHIEKYLVGSQMPYTIFRLAGFMQGLIGQYAIPILEEQIVWVTSESVPTAYLDTLDAARFAVRALSLEAAKRQIFPLVGPKAWTSQEVIALCEQLSGKRPRSGPYPGPVAGSAQGSSVLSVELEHCRPAGVCGGDCRRRADAR